MTHHAIDTTFQALDLLARAGVEIAALPGSESHERLLRAVFDSFDEVRSAAMPLRIEHRAGQSARHAAELGARIVQHLMPSA